ncbi:MAG: hypothetical protein J7513_16955 [Solirubrobacteraceae bacterium]|nr:hypothetical protein [Solirubrobacteraceae bacterium]
MKITIESRASRGVSLLPEIPDYRVALIEGRNGIGKTLSVRLLQLIGGTQPFDARAQWDSLKARLGNTEISISQMAGGEVLHFTFTPESWPGLAADDDPPSELGDWLGHARINGESVSVADAASRLDVVRFNGNEDLEQTLRGRLDLYRRQAAAARSVVRSRILEIQDVVDPLIELVGRVDATKISADRKALVNAEETERGFRARLDAIELKRALVLDALDSRDRLAQAGSQAQMWAARSTEIASRLREIAAEQPKLEAAIDAAAAQQRRHGDVDRTLAEARKLERSRLTRRRNREREVAELRRLLGVTDSWDEISELERATRARVKELEAERKALDANGSTLRLIDQLDAVLSGDAGTGLDDQSLLVRPDEDLTVSEVRVGLEARAGQLREMPSTDAPATLLRQVQIERRKLFRATELKQKIGDLDRAQQLLNEATQEAATAAAKAEAAGGEDERIKELTADLVALEDEANRLALEQAELNAGVSLEGGRSAEDAQADLARALDDLGLGELDLPDAELASRSEVADATRQLNSASAKVDLLRRNIAAQSGELEAVVATLTSEPRFDIARTVPAIADLVASAGSEPARIDDLARVLKHADEKLRKAESLIDQLVEVTSTAMDSRSGRSPVLTEAIRRALNQELQDALNQPSIQELVFDDARVSSVDLLRRQLELLHEDGTSDTRGFATFSTGEQAFAFTQARILELPRMGAPNRVLVLDEFGAFVAADRLPALEAFLASAPVHDIVDQVFVVLPLQADYETELEQTTGELRERYAARVEQLKEKRYFVIPLAT